LFNLQPLFEKFECFHLISFLRPESLGGGSFDEESRLMPSVLRIDLLERG